MTGILDRKIGMEVNNNGTRIERRSHIAEITDAIELHKAKRDEANAQIAKLARGKLTPEEISTIVKLFRGRLRPLHRQVALGVLQERRAFHEIIIRTHTQALSIIEGIERRRQKPKRMVNFKRLIRRRR